VSELGFSDIGFDLWPEEFYEEEGFSEEEELWVFETALDERVCPECGPLEGEPFLVEDIETYFPDAYENTDSTIVANLHENCRCLLTLVEEYEGEEETLDTLLGE
jgi:hypothetical protein